MGVLQQIDEDPLQLVTLRLDAVYAAKILHNFDCSVVELPFEQAQCPLDLAIDIDAFQRNPIGWPSKNPHIIDDCRHPLDQREDLCARLRAPVWTMARACEGSDMPWISPTLAACPARGRR